MSFTERLIESMGPWNAGPVQSGSTDLERYLRPVAQMFTAVAELSEEEGSDGELGFVAAWAKLMSPKLCPAKYLGYLGMYVGVVIPAGSTEAEARSIVEEHAGFSRGTPEAIEGAIYRNTSLTPTSHTLRERGVLIERRSSTGVEAAYEYGVSVAAANVPSEQTLETEVMAVTPAGLWPWFNYAAKYTWAEATGQWSEDTFAWSETTIRKP